MCLSKTLILALVLSSALPAGIITLEDTIPSGNLFLQPPVLTGAAPVFGSGGGVVVAEGFTAPVSAALSQVSVVVEYEDLPQFGVTGTSPMLLTLFTDSSDSPGTPIESWTVPLSLPGTTLAIVTVNSLTNSLLLAGHQYWLSIVPTDPIHTGIGWGLAAPGTQLPMTENNTGTNSGWGPTQLNLANEFSVSGSAVPEPATSALFACVLLSIVPTLLAKRNKSISGQSGV